MKKFIAVALLAFTACTSRQNQTIEAIKQNPKIIFDAIEENPEQFMTSVNRAAEAARRAEAAKQLAAARAQEESDLKQPKTPNIDSKKRLLGTDDSKIVVVEYADFQCPACRMAYDSLRAFKEKHKNQVQFYFKNMPLDFHKMAYPAATYFEALKKQDKVKAEKFYDFVFQNQNQMTDENFLKKVAAQVGADNQKLQKALSSEEIKKAISEDIAEFEKFGFTGTPTFIVNGVVMGGAQRLEDFERIAKLTSKEQM